MKVARLKKRINVSQLKYILALFTKTGTLGCKKNDTPIEVEKK